MIYIYIYIYTGFSLACVKYVTGAGMLTAVVFFVE